MSNLVKKVSAPVHDVVPPAPIIPPPPCGATLEYASQASMKHDKPISFDYWKYAHTGEGFLGVKPTVDDKGVKKQKPNCLFVSSDVYTSQITALVQSPPAPKGEQPKYTEFICITENTIYIVPSTIAKKLATHLPN